MSRNKTGIAFVLGVATAIELAALFYMLSDPDGPSLAEVGHSALVSLGTPSGVASLISVAIPAAAIVFLFGTKPGRAFMQSLHKNQSN